MPDFGIVCCPQLMHDRQTAMIGKLFKRYSPRFPNRVLSGKTKSRKPLFQCTSMQTTIRIGVLTVSDRASRGEYEDLGGPAIREYLQKTLVSDWIEEYRVVSDDRNLIAASLREMADVLNCCLIITTGGTGPAIRDVTPEATADVCEKMMPGFGELMRKVSLEKVPTAILSRQTAGIRGSCLIVNLPGQPKAIRECLDAVMPAIPYCIDLIGGPRLETDPEQIRAFRPKGK
jgi:molybdopterin adenylyltransferase